MVCLRAVIPTWPVLRPVPDVSWSHCGRHHNLQFESDTRQFKSDTIKTVSRMPMLHLTGTLVVLVVHPDDMQQAWDRGRIWGKYLAEWNVCMSGCLSYHSQSLTIVVQKCCRSCVLPYLEEKVPKMSEFESGVCCILSLTQNPIFCVRCKSTLKQT